VASNRFGKDSILATRPEDGLKTLDITKRRRAAALQGVD